jgi:hypothetical protein
MTDESTQEINGKGTLLPFLITSTSGIRSKEFVEETSATQWGSMHGCGRGIEVNYPALYFV